MEPQMLRTIVIALALGLPGVAVAQDSQFRESAVGIEVRGDDGTVVGRVNAVERDADGRMVAVEIAGHLLHETGVGRALRGGEISVREVCLAGGHELGLRHGTAVLLCKARYR